MSEGAGSGDFDSLSTVDESGTNELPDRNNPLLMKCEVTTISPTQSKAFFLVSYDDGITYSTLRSVVFNNTYTEGGFDVDYSKGRAGFIVAFGNGSETNYGNLAINQMQFVNTDNQENLLAPPIQLIKENSIEALRTGLIAYGKLSLHASTPFTVVIPDRTMRFVDKVSKTVEIITKEAVDYTFTGDVNLLGVVHFHEDIYGNILAFNDTD
jgi:hypothetical protein